MPTRPLRFRALSSRSGKPHRAGRFCPHARRLGIEILEDRRLLSVAGQEQAIEPFSTSPTLFVENQGQWADESVRFLHESDGARTVDPVGLVLGPRRD